MRHTWKELGRFGIALALIAYLALLAYCLLGGNVRAYLSMRAAQRDLEQFDFASAAKNLEVCLKYRPKDAQVAFLAARTARRQENYADALRLLDEYIRLGGDAEARSLEQTLARAQQNDTVLVMDGLWELVEASHTDSPLILEALALGFARQKLWGQALTCLDRLIKEQPNHSRGYALRGLVNESLQLAFNARADYQEAIKLNPNHDEARQRLAFVQYAMSEFREALANLEYLSAGGHNLPLVLAGKAACLRHLGRIDEAAVTVAEALALEPNLPLALGESARISLEKNNLQEAEASYRRSLALHPYDAETHYSFALCLERLGKSEESCRYFELVRQIEEHQKHLSHLFKSISKDPKNMELRLEAALMLIESGQRDEGARLLANILREDPKHEPTHAALAHLCRQQGDMVGATCHRRLAGTAYSEDGLPIKHKPFLGASKITGIPIVAAESGH